MDYEKKYKEALEKARQFSERPLEEDSSIIVEYIFPELKENEDELIRKTLIDFFLKFPFDRTVISSTNTKKILAWLEKQDETSKEWTISDAATLKELIDFLENGTAKLQHDLTRYANWLKIQFTLIEKQGEKKTINQLDIEIPFGAKDSELIEESYYIPKGYHAEISKDKVTIKKGEQKTNSQNAQDIIKKYVSDHADCRWLDASELEQLLNDFVLEYDIIKNREYEQQCKVSNDGNNR